MVDEVLSPECDAFKIVQTRYMQLELVEVCPLDNKLPCFADSGG